MSFPDGTQVRQAINQGLARAEMASTSDTKALRLYQANDRSKNLVELCGSAVENYMAAISCLLRAVPCLDQIDERSGTLVRNEIDRMLLRLEEIETIRDEVNCQEGNELKLINERNDLGSESSFGEHEHDADGFDVGCRVKVKINETQWLGASIVIRKYSNSNNLNGYSVAYDNGDCEDFVIADRIRYAPEDCVSTDSTKLKTTDQRQNVIDEIIQTERNYVSSLSVLLQQYLKPLLYPAAWGGTKRESTFTTKIITLEHSRTMFGNLEQLVGTNEMFLASLEQRYANWEPESSTIGDIFIRFAPFFKAYSGYSNGFMEGTKLAVDLQVTRPPFAAFLRAAEERGYEELHSLMIKPVQRVPRYVLLLKELLKRTDENHPDHPLIQRALESIKLVAAHIDSTMHEYESQSKMYATSRLFNPTIPSLVQPHRKFFFRNKMVKVTNGKKKMNIVLRKEYRFWLFSDIVLYGLPCMTKHSRFKLQRSLNITGVCGLPFSGGGPSSFTIHTTTKDLKLCAPNVQVKSDWVKVIHKQFTSHHTFASTTKSIPSSAKALSDRSRGNYEANHLISGNIDDELLDMFDSAYVSPAEGHIDAGINDTLSINPPEVLDSSCSIESSTIEHDWFGTNKSDHRDVGSDDNAFPDDIPSDVVYKDSYDAKQFVRACNAFGAPAESMSASANDSVSAPEIQPLNESSNQYNSCNLLNKINSKNGDEWE